MGKLLLVLLFASVINSRAGVFIAINNQFTRVFTNTVTVSTTNGVTATNIQGSAESVYHQFQYNYTATGTNSMTVATDRTIDGTTWFPVFTNSFTASGQFETNFVGKWAQYRYRTTTQNSNTPTLLVNYMSQ